MCLTHISAAGLTNSHVIKQEQTLCNTAAEARRPQKSSTCSTDTLSYSDPNTAVTCRLLNLCMPPSNNLSIQSTGFNKPCCMLKRQWIPCAVRRRNPHVSA